MQPYISRGLGDAAQLLAAKARPRREVCRIRRGAETRSHLHNK